MGRWTRVIRRARFWSQEDDPRVMNQITSPCVKSIWRQRDGMEVIWSPITFWSLRNCVAPYPFLHPECGFYITITFYDSLSDNFVIVSSSLSVSPSTAVSHFITHFVKLKDHWLCPLNETVRLASICQKLTHMLQVRAMVHLSMISDQRVAVIVG